MKQFNDDSKNDGGESSSFWPTGSTVSFPYEHRYQQQTDLMDTFLKSLQLARSTPSTSPTTNDNNKKSKKASCPIFMLESPTGTGKSLSLACAAMSWLRHVEQEDLLRVDDNTQRNEESPKSSASISTSGLDWLDDWIPPEQRERNDQWERVRKKAIESRRRLVEELSQIRSKFLLDCDDNDKQRQQSKRHNMIRKAITATKIEESRNKKSQRRKLGKIASMKSKTDDFILDEYKSDEEQIRDSSSDLDDDDNENNQHVNSSHLPSHLLIDGPSLDGSGAIASIHRYNGNQPMNLMSIANVQPGSGVRKIIYAARTHSQLSQFVGEIKRTGWGTTVRVVALGGRKALCGNQSVNKKAEHMVNEICLDFQKGIKKSTETSQNNNIRKRASSSSSGCPLLSSRDAIDTLALYNLAHPTDIEEASRFGESTQTCAYYATRAALQAAEVVVLPYSMLLSQQTRAAIGLSLKEALVIVDEAHNLPEALRALHSCKLPLPVVQAALGQLDNYIRKYADRLAGRNIHYLGQIKKILLAFEKHLQGNRKGKENEMITAAGLLVDLKLDNVNLFKILRYLERTRLNQKLLGFTNKIDTENHILNDGVEGVSSSNTKNSLSKHVSAMSVVQTFLEKLTLNGNEGKIVTEWPTPEDVDSRSGVCHPTLRYVLLDPASFFDNVVNEAHALALVGGTLKPFAHVAAELLGSNESIVAEATQADANLKMMESKVAASFISRTFTAFTCDHVVSSSNVLLQCLPEGPTNQVFDFRHQSRYKSAVCDELGATLVRICETAPSGVVVFLASYSYEAFLVRRWRTTGIWEQLQTLKKLHREPKSSQQVDSALQAYARDARTGALLLSVIGGKMSEGINFSNDMARCVVVVGLPYPDITDPELKEKMRILDNSPNKAITGRSYYQNLCMRAVNQSVGRAIRHANDFAAIVLIDSRYTSDHRIWAGLPDWLKRGKVTQKHNDHSLHGHILEMKAFFEAKK